MPTHGIYDTISWHICDAELHNVDGSATNIFVAAEYVIQVTLLTGDMDMPTVWQADPCSCRKNTEVEVGAGMALFSDAKQGKCNQDITV